MTGPECRRHARRSSHGGPDVLVLLAAAAQPGLVDRLPEGLEDVSSYPRLLAALRERGWSDDDLAKLTCRNVLRTMREVERAAER
ncbi:MAG: membrane dipeptidase [Nocardioides sp.]